MQLDAPLSWRPAPWIAPALLVVLAVASTPLALLAWAWLALMYCQKIDRRTIAGLLACVVFSMAVMYASRQVGGSPFDDFWNFYYPAYLDAKSTASAEFLTRPFDVFQLSSLEVAFPSLLALLALLPGILSPSLLILVITAGIGGLYAWWLLRYFLPGLPQSHRTAAALFCIVFFSFGLCSQTVRQMLSIPLLLAAVWERRLGKSAALAVIATASHLSAAPIWAFAILFRFTGYRTLVLAVVPLLYMLTKGAGLADSLIGLDPGTIDKLRYYTENNDDAQGYDSGFIPLILLVAAGSLFVVKFRNGELSRLLLFFCLLFFALLPLPLASFRATLFITAALLAPVACLALVWRIPSTAFTLLCGVLTFSMLARRVVVVDDTSGMALWYLFSPVETLPFQYVFRILAGA